MMLLEQIFEDQLFSEAANNWNLQRLYAALDSAKQQQLGQKQLTPLEKACLRGLLCGFSPQEITSQFPGESNGVIVNLVWKLHRCVETMMGRKPQDINSYRDIPEWLEAAGYKKMPVASQRQDWEAMPVVPQRQDWEAAPDVSVFYGRSEEQETLKQWIGKQRCRLVAIAGIVGIGKTALAAKVVKEIQGEFECVIWRSLRHAPPFNQLLAELLQFLCDRQETDLPEDTYSSISKLIKYFRSHRCLVILDDWDKVLEKGELADSAQNEYQGYRELLQRVGEVSHQSCLLINSAEKPREIAILEGNLVRSLQLAGLGKQGREILKAKGLQEEHLWERLIQLYRGNPLQLKLVATTIKNVFGGSISAFLSEQTICHVIVHETSKEQLDQQFRRLSELERQILYTLASKRQPMSREQLREDIKAKVYSSNLTEALASLLRRSLIETTTEEGKQLFTLQPMVMKHVIREYLPTTSVQKPAIAVSQPQQKSEPPQAQSAATVRHQQPAQPPAAVSAAKQKGSSLIQPPQAQSAQSPAVVSAAKQKKSNSVQPPQTQSAQSPAAVSAVKQKKSNLAQPPQAQSPAAARPEKPAQSPAAIPTVKQKESNLVQSPSAQSPGALRSQKPAQSPAVVPAAEQKKSNLVQTEHVSLPSVQENEFLPPISRWTRLGGLFIAGSVGVTIALAAFTPYNVTVQAQASVRPSGELRLVEAEAEGTILDIRTKGNQSVKKGDIIATIDDSRLKTQKSQLQSNIQQAQLQLQQINAQIQAQDSRILAETDRINRTVVSAEAELRRRQRDYRDRKITSSAQVEEAKANLRQAQEELQRAQAELRSAQANLSSAVESLKAAQSKRNRYQKVAREGALSQDQLEEAQLAVKQQEQAVQGQKAAVKAQKETIERYQQAVKAAQARLRRVNAALNPSNAEVAIAKERIAQEKATGQGTLATLKKERQALIQQRIGISKQIESDRLELKKVERELSKTAITATENGIISKQNLRNPGQTVRVGEEIAQIVPSNAPLVIKAAVTPQDKSKLAEGQKVHMRVSACPYPDYGTLNGKVSEISQDTIKPQDSDAGAITGAPLQKGSPATAFYEVTVEPESQVLGEGKNTCSIELGLEGRVDIIAREETVLKFVLRKARLLADL